MAVDYLERSSATVDDMFREALKLRDIVSDAVADGAESAVRAMKQGRHRAEHAIHDARRAIKRHPLQSAGVVFASGVLTGTLLSWMVSRRH
jgi:ElaB/YqjD/DUF883 family membrane-anchored ribosome-binding protein